MIFNSLPFFVFFLLFFFSFWIINNKSKPAFRNLFTILGSYIFYGWWDWRFLGLIVASSTVDFTVGLLLRRSQNESVRRSLLICSIAVNLGILGFFKYFNFFIDSLHDLMDLFSISLNLTTLNIILPVGISFYTFQTLSYTIDVYRRKLEPTGDVLSFFAFVSFFPQLVAGPIERASRLLNQFRTRKTFNYEYCVSGMRLVLWGFFKKVVIADNFGVLADGMFQSGQSIPGISVLIGAVFFALQIYADFSGYSDIAIGVARMLGFDLMTNFRSPYFASSFGDFWRRWHISLSTWFRDYVYIPLGGNRKGKLRTSWNLIITFLLSGLWHGANMTFLVWGGLHGLALVIEKRVRLKVNRNLYSLFVIGMVVLLWIPFRAEDTAHLMSMAHSITRFGAYSFGHISSVLEDFSILRSLTLAGITVLFILLESRLKVMDFSEWVGQKSKVVRLAVYYILLLTILLIGNFSVKPDFIYFQF